MITKHNRFHGHTAVSHVRGPSVHSKHVSARVSKGHKDDYRLAIVVSKKVDTRAVVRNRIRRRVFEAIRKYGQLTGKKVDMVVYVKNPAVATVEASALEKELFSLCEAALKKIGVQ